MQMQAEAVLGELRDFGFITVVFASSGDSTDEATPLAALQGTSERGHDIGSAERRSDHVCLPACSTVRELASALEGVAARIGPDFAQSWFIGDRSSRIRAANASGIRTILLESCVGGTDRDVPGTPEFTVPGIDEALQFIKAGFRSLTGVCTTLSAGVRQGDVVLVGGLSRSGKTTFAHGMKFALKARGVPAQVLSIDRFLKDREARSPGVIGRYDVGRLERLVRGMLVRTGPTSIGLPVYDKLEQRAVDVGDRMLVSPEDAIIVEGTIALAIAEGTANVHRFYVEVDETERRRRVIGEYLIRGRTRREAEDIYSSRQHDETPTVCGSSVGATRVAAASFMG